MELGSISTWEQWSMWNRFKTFSFHELIFREKSETKIQHGHTLKKKHGHTPNFFRV